MKRKGLKVCVRVLKVYSPSPNVDSSSSSGENCVMEVIFPVFWEGKCLNCLVRVFMALSPPPSVPIHSVRPGSSYRQITAFSLNP